MKKRISYMVSLFLSTAILVGCSFGSSEEGATKAFLHGKGEPSNNIGSDYSHYYDEESKYVYEKNDGKWINKYAIGGEGLYNDILSNSNLSKRKSRSKSERESLILMLSNSFYSTNISASYCWVDENDNMPENSYDLQMKVYKEYSFVYSKDNEGIAFLFKSKDDGHEIYEDGQYHKIASDDQILTLVPFPNFDSITYHNFGIYQEDLGQMTAIVAANVNKAYFDEASGLYKIDKIKIKHGELQDSCYMKQADKLTFSFWFKPSIDNEYVEEAYFHVDESEVGTFKDRMKITFYDYHITEIELPE